MAASILLSVQITRARAQTQHNFSLARTCCRKMQGGWGARPGGFGATPGGEYGLWWGRGGEEGGTSTEQLQLHCAWVLVGISGRAAAASGIPA